MLVLETTGVDKPPALNIGTGSCKGPGLNSGPSPPNRTDRPNSGTTVEESKLRSEQVGRGPLFVVGLQVSRGEIPQPPINKYQK